MLASGVMNIYPPEHDKLADEVVAHGALVSESPPRSEPLAGTFPQRNRLISGMSLGVIVVEAAERSGALITARHAMEQGREVFAVPGNVDSRTSRGCHQLIRDGAKLVESADDVLEELGPLVEAAPRADGQVIHHPAELLLNELEQQVLAAIGGEATSIDRIVSGHGFARFAGAFDAENIGDISTLSLNSTVCVSRKVLRWCVLWLSGLSVLAAGWSIRPVEHQQRWQSSYLCFLVQ